MAYAHPTVPILLTESPVVRIRLPRLRLGLLSSSAPLSAAFRATVFVMAEEVCEVCGLKLRVSASCVREGMGSWVGDNVVRSCVYRTAMEAWPLVSGRH